ncbi:MAG: gamma-glutamyl-gamma-aminobutyrate hydrolase family protein [Cardiobacteriaceae bacterium]|nr:gamma-glutamyl-gamma-aminobutyrate hydrolase family protein [Cardiobacteriaceae bacterium]
MLRIVAILHNPAGSTGQIGKILNSQDVDFRILCPLAGDALPEQDSFDAAIVFGGKMSANDCNSLPALLSELLWIRTIVDSGKPFLGICLGAQLLAMAYGGKITRHAESVVEIGYYVIYPTVEGFTTIFSDIPERFFQWHNEGFTLPDGAVKLAASDAFPNQAFSIGKNAYGFQFHPEATLEQIRYWHTRDSEELQNPGAQTVASQWSYQERHCDEIFNWLEGFLTHWITQATSS